MFDAKLRRRSFIMKAIKRKIRSSLGRSLVLLAAFLFGLVGSANAVTYREDFEAGYFDGAELQYHCGWFQTRKTDMTKIDKESPSERYRLGMGDWAFAWIAHPFSWSELSVNDCVILAMDFKTNSAGVGNPFNDDRVGWNIKDDDTDSDLICGVQFDDPGSVIEGYWLNTSGTSKPKPLITDDWEEGHPKRSTWYRLNAKFTKKGDTRFEVYVAVDELNDDGSIATENVITGSLDTNSLGSDAPHSKYFDVEMMWPAFKNYDSSSDGPADNAYFHIDDGIDDVAEVEVTDNSAIENGGTGEFKLRLQSQPSQDVKITCIPVINGEDIDLGGGAGLSVTKTFTNTNWSTWQSITVTAYNDDETEANEVAWIDFYISSNDNDFDGHSVAPLPVRIKIDDNDNDDQSDALVAGPYIIYPNDVSKMMVLWILESSPTCKLEWSQYESLDPCDYNDSVLYNNTWDSYYQYRYPIGSLSTNTKYYYRLSYSTGGKSYEYRGSFYTAPSSDMNDVKFLVYGDTRGTSSHIAYGHDSVCSAIMDTIAIDSGYQTFLLHAADWVQNGNSNTDWEEQFFGRDFSNARSMLANLPVMGCIGNHEFSGGTSTLFPNYYPYDEIYWPDDPDPNRYYYFDYGPVRFVVTDQYINGASPKEMGTAQVNWIKNKLSNSTKKWNFLLFHDPLYSAGPHYLSSTLKSEMEDLFENEGNVNDDVDIVFCGHNHNYARYEPSDNNVVHITTGGGGAPPSRKRQQNRGIHPSA